MTTDVRLIMMSYVDIAKIVKAYIRTEKLHQFNVMQLLKAGKANTKAMSGYLKHEPKASLISQY